MPKMSRNRKTKSSSNISVPSPQKIKVILRKLPQNQGFHFYEDIDKPTGQVASNLLDFCVKLDSAQSPQAQTSLRFHTKRGDFTAWLREAIGDSGLADKISKISPDDPHLAKKLHKAVDNRINQLKKAVVSYAIILENHDAMPRLERMH